MADFVQTMKDWRRMCNVMAQEDEYSEKGAITLDLLFSDKYLVSA